MQATVALRERGRLAALLRQLWHTAGQQPGWREPDRRNTRTWRQLVLAVLVKRSTRLVALGQAVFAGGRRAAGSVKAVAMGLAYFLREAGFPAGAVSPQILEAAARALPPAQVATYRGRAIVVLDPTEYPKRSRGRGRRGRQMEHVGRVRRPARGGPGGGRARRRRARAAGGAVEKARAVATTTGYVDVWAGLVLTGKQCLPLARRLFSNRHPDLTSQNRVEEAVLAAALAVLDRLGRAAIVVADRGLGRKELLVDLVARARDLVIRVDADITAFTPAAPAGALLAALLAQQPWRGEVVWDRGQEGQLPCRARTLAATIRFSRTGRRGDVTAAALRFVELVPLDESADPLVPATTLPLETPADVAGVVRVYAWRWRIETAFETMKAWGLGRFMVRAWQAIDRLLWIVAVAYALLVLALRDPPLAILREQAGTLLKRAAVLGRRLTAGKLAEAIGLDYSRHRRAWTSAWLPRPP
jgi:Transposase DDE domain